MAKLFGDSSGSPDLKFLAPAPEWKLLRTYGPWAIPQAPNTVIVDQIIDLGEWGLVNDQYILQPDIVFLKPDGSGGWMPTYSSNNVDPANVPPGAPSFDPDFGQTVFGGFFPITNAGNGYPAHPSGYEEGIDNAWQLWTAGVSGIEQGSHDPNNKCRYARLYIARGAAELTPDQWAIAQQRRIHVNLTGPDTVAKEWSFPIPATKGASIADFKFDLRDYGVRPGRELTMMTIEFRRNGQIIRGDHSRSGLLPNAPPPYSGEGFDPPTYPVKLHIVGTINTPDYAWEGNNAGSSDVLRYGDYERFTPFLNDDINVLRGFNFCTDPLRSLVHVQVWRDPASDGQTDYRVDQNSAPIAIPAGAKDNCTIHIKLHRAGPQHRDMYPYDINGNYPNPWTMQTQIAALESAVGPLPVYYDVSNPGAGYVIRPAANTLTGKFIRYQTTLDPGARQTSFVQFSDGSEWMDLILMQGDGTYFQRTATIGNWSDLHFFHLEARGAMSKTPDPTVFRFADDPLGPTGDYISFDFHVNSTTGVLLDPKPIIYIQNIDDVQARITMVDKHNVDAESAGIRLGAGQADLFTTDPAVSMGGGGRGVELKVRLDGAARTLTLHDGASVRDLLAVIHKLVGVTYSASMNLDAKSGGIRTITATDNTAFAINAPTNAVDGAELAIRVKNTSGGALGTATWDAVFKMATWAQPASGTSTVIKFFYDGANWVELSRVVGIPN